MRRVALLLVVALLACGGDDDAGDPRALCDLARQFDQRFGDDAFQQAQTTEEVRRQLAGSRDLLDSLRDEAPATVSDDVSTVAGAWAGFVDALEDAGYDLGKVDRAASEPLSRSAVRQAGDRVERFLQEECEIPPRE